MSTADYQRAWRKRHSQGGRPGRPVTFPCGTWQAHRRHMRAGEPSCGPCRLAYNEHQRVMYRNRKSTG